MRAPVVTGIGVVAPNGVGTEAYWSALLDGKSGIGRIAAYDPSSYPVQLAGEVTDLVVADWVPGKLVPQTDHMTHLGLAATAMALEDAGVDPRRVPEYEMGVVTANSSGGTMFGQRELEKLWRRGPLHVGAFMSVAWFYAATTGQISILHGMRGPCGVVVSEQAGGLDALATARRQLRRDARMVVTGGTDASLSPAGLAAQIASRALSTEPDPAKAYLPFDRRASGFVAGQGGAILLLERPGAARERGARPYGCIAGWGAAFDPPPGAGRPPNLRRAAERALADAEIGPGDIDVVFADGAGLPEADRQEAEALRTLFGAGGVPVTVPKTMTGRLYAGGGALDVATALLAVRDGVIPPTVNVDQLEPGHGLDLVRDRPRPAALRCALVLARGRGGFNAAVVVRAADHMPV